MKKTGGNFDSMCILDNNAQIELQWWEHDISTFNIIDQNVLPNIEIFSDVCLTGWGAKYNGHSTGGHWSVEELKSHINVLEMKGALFALKIYWKGMYKVSIQFKIDYTSTIIWINKQRAPNKETFDLVKEFWELCIERKIQVFASYLKSKRNKIADFESRKIRENLEWSIHDHTFSHITNYFECSFTIDLFASRANTKVSRYYAFYVEPDSVGTGAFSFSWQCEFFYAFPHFSIIDTVLRKIENEQAEGIIIVPLFTTQPWFIRLLRILVRDPFTLPTSKKALYFPYRRKTKPEMPDIKLLACHTSGNHSKIKAYQEILQRYSSSRGEMAPDRAMTAKSLYGQHFVMNGKSITCSRL